MKKLILSTVLMIVLVITAVASCSSNAEKMAEEEGIIVSSPDIEYPGGSKIAGIMTRAKPFMKNRETWRHSDRVNQPLPQPIQVTKSAKTG
jgi:hypothetical protein